MSNSNQAILTRVREALSVPTDSHVRHAPAATPGAGEFRAWLPQVEDTHESRVAIFAELSEKLQAEFVQVPDRDTAKEKIIELAHDLGWDSVCTHGGSVIDDVLADSGLNLTSTDDGYDTNKMEAADAGITECDAMIAQTGSVLITTKSAGGRALSVLPPHHVVIATKNQLVSDMAAGYAVLRERYQGDWPSFISFITGPSRTGDIERILVLGAHGPKRLTVILIEED